MNPVFLGYLRLMRPANLPTAAADILAGVAIAGISMDTYYMAVDGIRLFPDVLYLCLGSASLYAGGVVLNDVFDLETDRKERPERPLPSGLIALRSAILFGIFWLVLGILFGFLVNTTSGWVALILAGTIVLYDGFSKRYAFLGPLNMGVCRGLNLILGMSIAGGIPHPTYGLIPVGFIFAVTLISRGEVHGDNKNHIIWAALMYAGVIFAVLYIISEQNLELMSAIPFLLLFAALVFIPLIRAFRDNTPENIKRAVIAGVTSLIVLDAGIAAGFSSWWFGLLVLFLLPLSLVLSRIFAVT